MNNIILFILLILLLFYYINKEYENYENKGMYSSAATLDSPIDYKEDNKEDNKLKELFKNSIILRINKNKNIIILKEKLKLINQDISYIELSEYYDSYKHIYSTNEQQEIESLINIIQGNINEINKMNKTINSLSFRTDNERLQDKYSENDNELDIIHTAYQANESTNENYGSIDEYKDYNPDISINLSNELKDKSSDEFNKEFNTIFENKYLEDE